MMTLIPWAKRDASSVVQNKIGRKEQDWSDDDSDPMSQAGCIQCGTKQNR
jgi:hypothetical protein